MKQKLIELLQESTLIQGALTLLIAGVVCYMYVAGIDVPDTLLGVLTLIIGYYFGNKSQQQIDRYRSVRKDK